MQIAQYARTSWTARDGAPLGLVFAVAQTPDGYLWIAGSFGIFRFDGMRFRPWQPPDGQSLPSGAYSLLVSRDGTLWIGTFGGLSSWDGRRFVRRHAEVGTGFVTSLLEDREGTVWAGVYGKPGRLCSIRAGQVGCTAHEGEFGEFVWSLAQDREGHLWVGAESGVWRWAPGAPRRYAMPGLRVGDLTTTAEGQVLVGAKGRGLWEVTGEQLVPHHFHHAGRPGAWLADRDVRSNKLLRDRDGGLWIGTEGLGLIHVKDGQADSFTRLQGLSGNIACSLFEDREGNIWYGSDKGVDRFRRLAVTTLTTQQGLPHELTRSVLATRDGSIWVATNDGLARWQNGSPKVFRETDGLPDADVQSQYQDADGRLWVSTSKGLAYFANERFIPVDRGPVEDTMSMTGDAEGNLWLAGRTGLARLQRGRFVEHLPWSAVGQPQPASTIVADRGGLWMSFWGGWVSYVRNGRLERTYTSADGLGKGGISGLRLDAEGAIWAATGDGGVSRIKDGRVTTLGVANGLPCKTVHWSAQDRGGSLWLFTSCGLVRVGREDLDAWMANPAYRFEPRQWAAADGVPLMITPPAYYNPPVAWSADGKLWSAGAGEVQLVDPDRMSLNPVPPPVHIETLVADQKAHSAFSGLRLAPLTRDIAIEYAALTLVDPKSTRFRYRLDGHDLDWQEVVDRRQASYTNLPPGNYRFRVKAANNSGVWNEEGAQLEFVIPPAFYQTTWFRLAVAVALAVLAWGGFQLRLRMRVRRLQRQFETMLDARVAERTRIARDLHDTLLQQFHGLLLQFQAALNLLPDRAREARQVLADAIDSAAAAVTAGRDAVQGLRASPLEMNDLPDSLRARAQELAATGGHAAGVRVDVQGRPRNLHPLVRDETFRIAGEALRNAFHHAEARQVVVDIGYGAQQFSVRVRDDGKGIDAEVLRAGEKTGHFGLNGMRERAALAGGELTVQSSPGEGTVVDFKAPAGQAYSTAASARSWFLHKKAVPSERGP